MSAITKERFVSTLNGVQARKFSVAHTRFAIGLGQVQRLKGLFDRFQLTTNKLYDAVSEWSKLSVYTKVATTTRAAGSDYWKGNLVLRFRNQEWDLLDNCDLPDDKQAIFLALFSLNQGLFGDGCYLDTQAIPEPSVANEAFQQVPSYQPNRVAPPPNSTAPTTDSPGSHLGVVSLGLFLTSRGGYYFRRPPVTVDASGKIILSLDKPPPEHLLGTPHLIRIATSARDDQPVWRPPIETPESDAHYARDVNLYLLKVAIDHTLGDEQLCALYWLLVSLLLHGLTADPNAWRPIVDRFKLQPFFVDQNAAPWTLRELLNHLAQALRDRMEGENPADFCKDKGLSEGAKFFNSSFVPTMGPRELYHHALQIANGTHPQHDLPLDVIDAVLTKLYEDLDLLLTAFGNKANELFDGLLQAWENLPAPLERQIRTDRGVHDMLHLFTIRLRDFMQANRLLPR